MLEPAWLVALGSLYGTGHKKVSVRHVLVTGPLAWWLRDKTRPRSRLGGPLPASSPRMSRRFFGRNKEQRTSTSGYLFCKGNNRRKCA